MSREGQNYCFYVPLPEEIEQLTDLLESAGTERNSDEQILKIIEEEAAVCFDGQKTPEQTAELIESRVANYLAEQAYSFLDRRKMASSAMTIWLVKSPQR